MLQSCHILKGWIFFHIACLFNFFLSGNGLDTKPDFSVTFQNFFSVAGIKTSLNGCQSAPQTVLQLQPVCGFAAGISVFSR